ncbi:germin-like protein subfamily 1 member 7 [Gossypium hirsutum]|uniref:Germin-like protein n=1 Tax=Gossypium hirsutum TaxID=3635 RepID=A0A1U8PVJ0_GOSHI|nr:germin-like protein subfamily 1 member 7 [Gossypium hirsutum]
MRTASSLEELTKNNELTKMCMLTKAASLPNLRANLRALHYAIFVNGKFCKDPKLATLEDFFLLGHNIRGNTSNRLRLVVTPANDEQIPGLNSVGTLCVGFTTSNLNNHLFTKVFNPGDAFVFPISLIYFQQNIGQTHVVAFSAFSSQNPGTITIPNVLFGSDPALYSDVLAKAF